MPLTESIVEDASLTWFGELSYTVGHGPHLAPGGPASRNGGRDSFGELVLVSRSHQVVWRLNPASSAGEFATLLPRLLSGALRLAAASVTVEAAV